MRIPTTAEVTIIPTSDINPADLKPSADRDGSPRLTDGKATYPLRHCVVKLDGQTVEGASVKVLAPPTAPIPELTRAVLTGHIVVTPWLADGTRQIRLSILADGVSAKGEAK